MSGQNSYIGIMNHCFGQSGRAAVSLFQFAFAFGGMSGRLSFGGHCEDELTRMIPGMCAFGIIIGERTVHSTSLLTADHLQVIPYRTSSDRYFPTYTAYRCFPSSPSGNSSSPSAPYASRIHYPFTETSTNCPVHPVSHSLACSSSSLLCS